MHHVTCRSLPVLPHTVSDAELLIGRTLGIMTASSPVDPNEQTAGSIQPAMAVCLSVPISKLGDCIVVDIVL